MLRSPVKLSQPLFSFKITVSSQVLSAGTAEASINLTITVICSVLEAVPLDNVAVRITCWFPSSGVGRITLPFAVLTYGLLELQVMSLPLGPLEGGFSDVST